MRLDGLNIFRIGVLLISINHFSTSFAQFNANVFQRIKSEYNNEKVVQLTKNITYEIQLVKGKPEVILYTNESYIYLKDISVVGSKRSIYSSQIFKLEEYTANVYTLQDGKYKKTPVKDKKEISNNQQFAFFDDMQEFTIDFANVNEGAIVELNTVHRITEPRLIRTVFFNEYIPIDELNIKFVVGSDIDFKIIPVALDKVQVNYSEISEKSRKLYQWSGKKIPAIEIEENTPDEKYFIAHVIPVVVSYKNGPATEYVLRDVEDLYKWYYSFIEQATKDVNNGELKKLSDSITSGCSSEIEKVKSIYYWVQSNIKYIAFEDGMGGFIPRKPDEILHKRYGDCKDKSCILFTLLKLSGIESYFTWIGTNDIPYTYQQVATPSADNHMIITYKNNGNYYFLDGTSSNLPLGIPSSFIQGKEALIAIDKDTYEIQTVPVLTAEKNLICDSISIQMKDKQIAGSGTLSFSGYPFYFFHDRYSDRDNIDQKETVKNYLEKGNNKFLISEYQVENLKPFDYSGNLSYDFTLGDYVKSVDNEIYLNLNMDRSISAFRIDDKRKYPLFFEYNLEYRFKAVFDIPGDYEIGYIPKDATFDSPEYGYSFRYKLDGNKIIYEHSHYRNTLLIGSENLKNWKDYIKNIENAYKETVLLRKIKN